MAYPGLDPPPTPVKVGWEGLGPILEPQVFLYGDSNFGSPFGVPFPHFETKQNIHVSRVARGSRQPKDTNLFETNPFAWSHWLNSSPKVRLWRPSGSHTSQRLCLKPKPKVRICSLPQLRISLAQIKMRGQPQSSNIFVVFLFLKHLPSYLCGS